jgi:hypothetical protein
MELKIIVPTTLKEITLEQYQRFSRLEGDDDFLGRKALEIFCGVEFATLLEVKYKDVKNILVHVNKALEEKPPLTQRFKLNNVEYGFMPDLENISLGEFIDLDFYMRDVKDFHKMMAVMYRPVTSKAMKLYDIEPYEASEKYAEVMKQVDMGIVSGAVLFFYRLGIELLNATLTSSEVQTLLISPLQRVSEQNGDGTQSSITSLKEMLEDLTMSLN